MKRQSLFLDTEFTNLNQKSELISLGIVAERGERFYAEFSDFEAESANLWVKENVIARLSMAEKRAGYVEFINENARKIKGDKLFVRDELEKFLALFDAVEFWADCGAYDWVLFCELWGGSMNLPKQVSYMPMDLVTLLRIKGLDPDISREEFVKEKIADMGVENKHHALWDAQILQLCHHKLMTEY
ncbi:MAG: 3'-5' exoribonuclease [Bacteroidia bacterium]|nr:3'-5' exoribonuclease [Bacteroidia bacterium]